MLREGSGRIHVIIFEKSTRLDDVRAEPFRTREGELWSFVKRAQACKRAHTSTHARLASAHLPPAHTYSVQTLNSLIHCPLSRGLGESEWMGVCALYVCVRVCLCERKHCERVPCVCVGVFPAVDCNVCVR